jgi:hypothetical protein
MGGIAFLHCFCSLIRLLFIQAFERGNLHVRAHTRLHAYEYKASRPKHMHREQLRSARLSHSRLVLIAHFHSANTSLGLCRVSLVPCVHAMGLRAHVALVRLHAFRVEG